MVDAGTQAREKDSLTAVAHASARSIDWWGLVASLAPLLLLVKLRGALLGAPAADDFNYLYHALFEQRPSPWDGGGAGVFWRPLGRQGYFEAVSGLLLTHSSVVAAGHLVCLFLTSYAFYRAFRPTLGSVTACVVSTGPWLMDSGRMLIAWPSCFQDLGALLFLAVAYFEASAGRPWTCATAGLASILCKEVAAVPLACLPLCPVVPSERRATIARFVGVMLAVWLVAYLVVVNQHHLLPVPGHDISGIEGALSAGARTIWWSLLATVSIPPSGEIPAALIAAPIVLLVPWRRCHHLLASHSDELRRWWAWAGLWTVPLILSLLPLWPGWATYRMPLMLFGLVTAFVVTLSRLHRVALPAFVAVRFGTFCLAPPVAAEVATDPPVYGATMDIPRLTRLQRFVTNAREVLKSEHASLPHGTTVVWEQFPAMTEFGFAGAAAVQVWYRDTTLRWIPLRTWIQEGRQASAVILEYQPLTQPAVAIVSTEAMRALLEGDEALQIGTDSVAVRLYASALALQHDRGAKEFMKTAEGKREYASARVALRRGDYARAREHAHRVLALYPRDVPSQRLLRALEDSLRMR